MPDGEDLFGLGAQVDAIKLSPDTLDALAVDASLRSLRQHARWRLGRRTGYLLNQAADRLEERCGGVARTPER